MDNIEEEEDEEELEDEEEEDDEEEELDNSEDADWEALNKAPRDPDAVLGDSIPGDINGEDEELNTPEDDEYDPGDSVENAMDISDVLSACKGGRLCSSVIPSL